MTRYSVSAIVTAAVLASVAVRPAVGQTERIGALTVLEHNIPRRLVGYGLVVGLEGTGDQSFSSLAGATHTVQSVVNLLKRFGIDVPPQHMRLRNVAAVLVTAEASPYLRPGARFEVQVSSVGDATSLRGGVLWTTALVEDVGRPIVATAQGPVLVADRGERRFLRQEGTSARIPDGGVLEVESGSVAPTDSVRLFLKRPSLTTATRIANAVNAAFGAGVASVEDPGAVRLRSGASSADTLFAFLAAVDTLAVDFVRESRIIVDASAGTVVSGGDLAIGPAVVSHHGITLAITSAAPQAGGPLVPGVVTVTEGATVQEIAAGLHAAGARAVEIGAIFEALRDVGALHATVVIR